eukprot:scaffold40910_cov72-Phaeocystis_antarctica.AAC.7
MTILTRPSLTGSFLKYVGSCLYASASGILRPGHAAIRGRQISAGTPSASISRPASRGSVQ